MSGIPDYSADKSVQKRTMAVRFGIKGAARMAMMFTILAAATVCSYSIMGILPQAFNGILFAVIPHAILLVFMINKYIQNPSPSNRIDGLMIASLTYLIWFGAVPLFNLS
jgi:4-hydroxybenzoate polyprenyltransferase